MPVPSSSTTIQRPDLGEVAFAYMTDKSRTDFIGSRALPIFEVAYKTGEYAKIPIAALISPKDTNRAARSHYNRCDYEFTTGNYNCKDKGWEELLDDSEAENYKRFFDAEAVSIERATHITMLAHEIDVATALFNTSTFSNTAVSTEWSTAATATPHKDVTITGFNGMRAVGGLRPNKGLCSGKVFRNLINTDEVKDALHYTDPIEMGGFEAQKKMMAAYFGLDEILVGDAAKDTAIKGQTSVIGDVWDDEYFMLLRVDEGMDLKAPQVGRTFLWTDDSPSMITAEQYREENARSTVYRVRHNRDQGIIFAAAGYLLTNITA